MKLLTDVYAHIDNTIPLWSIVVALALGSFYIIKMKFEVDQLRKDLTEIKEMMHEFLTPKKK